MSDFAAFLQLAPSEQYKRRHGPPLPPLTTVLAWDWESGELGWRVRQVVSFMTYLPRGCAVYQLGHPGAAQSMPEVRLLAANSGVFFLLGEEEWTSPGDRFRSMRLPPRGTGSLSRHSVLTNRPARCAPRLPNPHYSKSLLGPSRTEQTKNKKGRAPSGNKKGLLNAPSGSLVPFS